MIIYYSIATSRAFKPSKSYNILVMLKGVIETERKLAFQKAKGRMLHMKITISETLVE